jgi:cyclopropane-fatty-acyl-phospholipid synthase
VLDYREYEPPVRFDAALAIGMMEHMATPEQTRRGEHLPIYRDFFRRVHGWTKPGAWMGFQTILRDRVPRDRSDLADVNWVTHHIFPGGQTPRLEDLVRSVGKYWEIIEIRTRREDYQRTTTEWATRLEANEETIRERWGDRVFEDYQRYLWISARAFERHYESLAQVRLRRVDAAA